MSANQEPKSELEAKLIFLKRQYDKKCRQLEIEYGSAVRREKLNFSRLNNTLERRDRVIRSG